MFVYHAAEAPFDYADEYVLQRNPRSDFGQKLYLSLTFDDANHYADYSGRDWMLIYEIPGCGDIAGLPGLAAFKGLSFHSFGSKTEFSPDDANGFLWGSTILANRLGIDSGRGMSVADVMFGLRADVHTNEVLNSFRNQYESGSWNPSDDEHMSAFVQALAPYRYEDQIALSNVAAARLISDVEPEHWHRV